MDVLFCVSPIRLNQASKYESGNSVKDLAHFSTWFIKCLLVAIFVNRNLFF